MGLPPLVYRASQSVLAPGARGALTVTLRKWAEGHEIGDAVLDVGCGPRSWLTALGVRPVGVDASHAAMRSFRKGSGPGVIADATALPFRTGGFDSAWCFGLLHHLPDDAAGAAVRELQRVTRSCGHAVVFDGILPTRKGRLLARLVRRFDRGRWMRSRDGLETLFDGAGTWHGDAVRYSVMGLEGVLATWTARS
jgi:SAM-dependent methyltransferase